MGRRSSIFKYLFLFVIQTSNLSTLCLKLRNANDSNFFYTERFEWITTLSSVNVIFCQENVTNSMVKFFMLNNYISVSLNSGGNICYNFSQNLNFVFITNSEKDNLTQECIYSSIPSEHLNFNAKLIFFDLSTRLPSSLRTREGSPWWFLGSANAVYLAGGKCWVTSPHYLAKRYMIPVDNCHSSHWRNMQKTVPDLGGEKVEVVTFHRPPSIIIHNNETLPYKRYDGMEVKVFMELASYLNLTWRVNELEGKSDKWGQLINGSWVGGVMEALTTGSSDVGFSTIWISAMQAPYLDYLTSWISISTVFLVPRPTLITGSWRSMFRPFSGQVWTAVSLTMAFFPMVILILHWIHERITDDKKHTVSSISGYWLYTLGTITNGCSRLGTLYPQPLRPMVAWWYVFVMLLCSYYTSNIVAHITSPSYTPKINQVRQLVEQGFSWGMPYKEDTLGKHVDFEKYWHRKFANNFIVYNQSSLKSLIQSKKFAITAQRIENSDYIIIDLPIDNDFIINLRLMAERIRTYYSAMAVRKRSRLRPVLDQTLLRVIETGLILFHKRDTARRLQGPAFTNLLHDSSTFTTTATPLTLDNYLFMFYILFVGYFISFICFVLEIVVHLLKKELMAQTNLIIDF